MAELLALGLVLAALGYAAFCLTGSLALPMRTQFFSAPGIALALGAAASLGLSFIAARWRQVLGGVVLIWLVAVATGRTVAMQRDWGPWSRFPAQNSLLVQLTRIAPDVRPHTLVLLIDDGHAFVATFTFRHAVSYLYQGRAIGVIWGASDYLYSSHFAPEGASIEPWPVIRGPWRSPPTFHRYDELIVVRYGADGKLVLLDEWPDGLPIPPPPDYRPRKRILRGGPEPPERGILRRAG